MSTNCDYCDNGTYNPEEHGYNCGHCGRDVPPARYRVEVREPFARYGDGSPVVLRECGHRHRSPRTAAGCMHRLLDYRGDGTHSAAWHHAQVARCDGNPLSEWEQEALDLAEQNLAT